MIRPTIAFVFSSVNLVGGMENITRNLIVFLYKNDLFNVLALCPGEGPVKDLLTKADIPVVNYVPLYLGLKNPIPYYRHVRRMVELFQHHQVNLVHGAGIATVYTAGLACRLARTPIVVRFGNVTNHCPLRYRPLLGLTEHLVFNSRYIQEEFTRISHRLAYDRGTVIYNGVLLPNERCTNAVQHHLRQEFGIRPDEAVVGIVGRLQYIKGQDVFIHAAREILEICPNVKFLVVGDPGNVPANQRYAQGLIELTDRLGLHDRVTFTGFRRNVNDIMALIDVLALASTHTEGFPNVILEGMAMGLPVVATHVGGVPEVVADGETGILVPPREPAAMAQAIIKLLQDEPRRRHMGKQGRLRVEKEFSFGGFIQQFKSIYENALEKR